jgi:hypothetical protein
MGVQVELFEEGFGEDLVGHGIVHQERNVTVRRGSQREHRWRA